MKPTYKKKTSFDVFIELGTNSYNVEGTYYYAPDEIYGESPNKFTQDDSEIEINSLCIFDKDLIKNKFLEVNSLLDFNDVYIKICELVWQKILDGNYED